MRKSAQHNDGKPAIVVVVLIAIVVVAGGIYLASRQSRTPVSGLGELPPVEARTNPEPKGEDSIYVGDIDPGTNTVIDEVRLSKSGYVAVQSADGAVRKNLGRSVLLGAGVHTDVEITTTETKDGDAVYVVLLDANGVVIKDENENVIEVLKNVGLLKGHQEASDYY